MPYRRPAKAASGRQQAYLGYALYGPMFRCPVRPANAARFTFLTRGQRVLPRLNRMAYDVVAVVCAQLPTDNGLIPFAYTVAPESRSRTGLEFSGFGGGEHTRVGDPLVGGSGFVVDAGLVAVPVLPPANGLHRRGKHVEPDPHQGVKLVEQLAPRCIDHRPRHPPHRDRAAVEPLRRDRRSSNPTEKTGLRRLTAPACRLNIAAFTQGAERPAAGRRGAE